MSDDLVQRMRAMANYESDPDGPCKRAADRIEALETALREIADTKDSLELGRAEPEAWEDQNMIDALIHIARRALDEAGSK